MLDASLYAPRRYRVRHATTYRYLGGDVTTCFERGMLELRQCDSQTVIESDLRITPDPGLLTTHLDRFGNKQFYAEIDQPYRKLAVVKESLVDVHWPMPDLARLNQLSVGEAADWFAGLDPGGVPGMTSLELATYLLPSRLVSLAPEVHEYARRVLPEDAPLGDAVLGLARTIFAEFKYTKGVTSTRTTLAEVLSMKAGVCQDFAHLAVGCLRSVGLPARYVSGYIETRPAPGKVKLAGSDATHAWASAAVPGQDGGVEWVDLDPTNDHLADSRYIVTAWGRDFSDVSPLRGVVFSDATSSSLKVGVDVIPVDAG